MTSTDDAKVDAATVDGAGVDGARVNDANVEFLFDFGSPNAYLSHAVIPAIEQRTGARFDYVPTLLGGLFKLTNNRSPMEAFAASRRSCATSAARPNAS